VTNFVSVNSEFVGLAPGNFEASVKQSNDVKKQQIAKILKSGMYIGLYATGCFLFLQIHEVC
jgi:hypothetical protein